MGERVNPSLFIFGIFLLLPGLFAAGTALFDGPGSWAVSQGQFWGTPIADFVFWIGLAHAGTFFSAVLLVLGARFGRRVALVAELSTIASLLVAATYPLIHLGVPLHFYAMIPVGNARHFYANAESPLLWDMVAIFVYAVLSTFYLLLHLFASKRKSVEKYRKPFAWILFPLVLWVHTIVSMDFAVTCVQEWRGGYFPLYFIFGALYSGVALVTILLELLHRRVRRMADLTLCFSWAMLVFWIWEAVFKGVWHPEILILGFLIPQLLWIPSVRENAFARTFIAFFILVALWRERLELVMLQSLEWTWVDVGLFAFGVGLFAVAFELSLGGLKRFFPEAFEREASGNFSDSAPGFARLPFAVSVLAGVVCAALFACYFAQNAPDFFAVRIIPMLLPIAALVAGAGLSLFAAAEIWGKSRAVTAFFAVVILAVALGGLVFRGADTEYSEPFPVVRAENPFVGTASFAGELWNARCAACHGKDGAFNDKFVHEYYPMPQKLSEARLDSLGMDSLVQVVLDGRGYMRPFRGRISEEEAKQLVLHLQRLAKEKGGR